MTTTAYNPPRTAPRLAGLGLLLLAALATAVPPVHAAPAAKAAVAASPVAGYARGRLLVQPRAGLPAAALDKEVRGLGGKQRALVADVQVIELPAGVDEIAAMNKLRSSGKFQHVELDMAVAPSASVSDPYFSKSWGVTKINAPLAWDNSTGDGIIVAVLDTGVFSAHPELAENMVAGWNTYDNNADTTDVYGHGTMVTGTIVMAADNALGSAGVAHRARVMPIRISDASGYGYWSTVAAGIRWAADHGARVANVSYDGMAGSSTVQAAAEYMRGKGGLVVVAAGNTSAVSSTAASPSLIVVSATDSADAKALFSTWGSFVDVAAPGKAIYTTNRSGGYSTVSGTSFASPITAATLALILSAHPGLDAAEAETLLFDSAVDLGDAGKDIKFGHGRIDAGAAVAAAVVAAGGHVISDNVAPATSITNPAGGASLAGVVNVDVAASDDRGVARVDLYLNGVKVASDSGAPYAFAVDTTAYADGAASLSARAVDAAGNVGESVPVAATIANAAAAEPAPTGDSVAPSIASFNVTEGQVVTALSTIGVKATAIDNVAVTRMQINLDGNKVSASAKGVVTYKLYVSSLSVGAHRFEVQAWDAAGNLSVKTVNFLK